MTELHHADERPIDPILDRAYHDFVEKTLARLRELDETEKPTLQVTVGALLRTGFSQTDLADKVDVARTTTSRWAAGHNLPSYASARRDMIQTYKALLEKKLMRIGELFNIAT